MLYGRTSSAFSAGCGSLDTVCKNIYYQSKCGARKRFATQASLSVGLYGRREQYWDPTCSATLPSLVDSESKVNNVSTSLLIWAVISIIINVVIGIAFPGMLVFNLNGGDVPCIPGDGEFERNLLKFYSKRLGLFGKLVKILVSVLFIILINGVIGRYERAVDCGAGLTNTTFNDLAENMRSMISRLTQALVVDAVMLVHALYEAYSAMVHHDDEDEDNAGDNDDDSEKVRVAPEPGVLVVEADAVELVGVGYEP